MDRRNNDRKIRQLHKTETENCVIVTFVLILYLSTYHTHILSIFADGCSRPFESASVD